MILQRIHLGVFRRLDNRREGLADDSPRGIELHERRKRTLHGKLDDSPLWDVTDWGYTNDSTSHELVDLTLQLRPYDVEISQGVVDKPSLAYVGTILIRDGFDSTLVEAVQYLIADLQRELSNEMIEDFHIIMPNNLRIDFRSSTVVEPTEQDFALTVFLTDGQSVTMNYGATQHDIAKLRET